eukprot:TRINITY_DN2546_c0_g1_i12.p1 TRINITY_DN2546_c0_g1~~TRINITY_DN2546_c0_g1_i12.p1  ORF type:complete len:291 (+),score=57.36 TRINITY_DN2546_c0_g1_i12:58-930(+)
MLPTVAFQNRPSNKRWSEHCQSLHKENLSTAKPMVDTTSFPDRPHLRNNSKRHTEQRSLQDTLDFDNKRITEKLAGIHSEYEIISKSPDFGKKSMNIDLRRRVQQEIEAQNKKYFERVNSKSPAYSRNKWDKDYKTTEQYLKLASTYNLTSVGDVFKQKQKLEPIENAPLPLNRSLNSETQGSHIGLQDLKSLDSLPPANEATTLQPSKNKRIKLKPIQKQRSPTKVHHPIAKPISRVASGTSSPVKLSNTGQSGKYDRQDPTPSLSNANPIVESKKKNLKILLGRSLIS